MKQQKTYELVDYPSSFELKTFFGEERNLVKQRNIRAIWTGEKRCPKAGEWYLSGSVVQAYRSGGGLMSDYLIARLVLTETETIVRTKIINDPFKS